MAAGGLFAAAAVIAPAANATTYPVNSLADDGDGTCDATCTLRDAVGDANDHNNGLNAPANSPDVITFASNVRGEIQLAAGGPSGNNAIQITSDSLHIQGPGADKLAVVGTDSDRIFKLFGFGTTAEDDYDVTISGLTLKGGHAVAGSDTRNGGAILSTDNGTELPEEDPLCGSFAALTLSGVHITGNETPDGVGGGVAVTDSYCYEEEVADKAAAPSDEEGALNVLNSTISGNHSGYQGGGIALEAASDALYISNSTLASNTAGGPGGGISIIRQSIGKATLEAPPSEIENSTITGNDAGGDGGGGIYTTAADVGLRSTIVHGNTFTESDVSSKAPGDIVPNDLANDVSGEFTAGYSLIGTRDGVVVNDTPGEPNLSANPQLGALGANGGPTPTMVPATTSPAIDTGIANGLTGDQRGLTRTVDRSPANAADGTDIGAVEIPADPVVPPDETPPDDTPLPGPATQLCLGKPVILTKGGDADEKLTGFGTDDGILAGGGQDQVFGIGGDDCLFGQVGNDLVEGGPGNDNANGDRDDDKVRGDGGADSVRGQNGNDRVYGGPGDDPKVTGGAGDDYVSGGDGDDLLKGDGGNDVVLLGGGEDFVHSGGGADVINAADHDRDTIICGTGKDVANVDPNDKVDADCNVVNVVNGSRRPSARSAH